tara:strand:- start:310 stop:723 length:414 start_codon:yes stop_codon:yes gene_type:complete
MMAGADIQKHSLKSELESLAKVELIIEDLREDYSISDDVYGNIVVSLSEATNNAIRHGNKYDPQKEVSLSLEITDKNYIFTIEDQGDGFDYMNIPDPTHPDNLEKPDGRGIFIMANLSDEIEFKEKGRIVVLSFERS